MLVMKGNTIRHDDGSLFAYFDFPTNKSVNISFTQINTQLDTQEVFDLIYFLSRISEKMTN